MTTFRQAESNRRNAEKSTGPKTEAGKAASRRNAMTHGLASETLLPIELEAAVAERVAGLSASFPPTSEIDQHQIEQAAIGMVRMKQAFEHEQLLASDQVRRAQECWDLDRRTEAAKILDRLHIRPQVLIYHLQKTTQGCQLMIERWESLKRLSDEGKTWSEPQLEMALDLIGTLKHFRDLARNDYDSVETQRTLADTQITRLKQRQTDALDDFDADDRDLAARGFALPDRETWRVRRYGMAATRAFNRALGYLTKNIHQVKPSSTFTLAPLPLPVPVPMQVPVPSTPVFVIDEPEEPQPVFVIDEPEEPQPAITEEPEEPQPVIAEEPTTALPSSSEFAELRAEAATPEEPIAMKDDEEIAMEPSLSGRSVRARSAKRPNRQERRAMAQRTLQHAG